MKAVVYSAYGVTPELAEAVGPGLLVGDVIALEDTGRALAAMSGARDAAGMTVVELPGPDERRSA